MGSSDDDTLEAGRFDLRTPGAALAVGVVVLVFAILSLPLAVAVHSSLIKNSLAPCALTLVFWVVGVLVARREPHNPIGWMLIASGALVMIGLIDAEQYSVAVYDLHDRELPLGSLAVIVGQCWPAALLFPPLAILLFPEGRLPSRRWRWVVRVYLGASAALIGEQVLVAVNAIADNDVRISPTGGYLTTPAPKFLQGELFTVVGVLLFVVIVSAWVAFVARRVVSYRRADGVRRQQLKWVMCGSAVTAVAIPVFAFVSVGWIQPFAGAAVAALPLAIGVGILRYRLYEIDVIIRKTLIYAILIGTLAIVYLVGVFVLDRALVTATGQSSALAVTVATLAVAVAFQPLRGRVQHLVDRRFYRGKYNADHILEGFTGRLRDQIDVAALQAEILHVVQATVQPRSASLWLSPTNAPSHTAPGSGNGQPNPDPPA